jgi:hypothetical protein
MDKKEKQKMKEIVKNQNDVRKGKMWTNH